MKKEKISGIYCIENTVNNKKYIGYAKNISHRWCIHKSELKGGYHTNRYLQHAYNKYGVDNFKYYIIQELEDDAQLLKSMEIYWICYYGAYVLDGGGYNLTRGGEGHLGDSPSEETRKKLSEANNGEKSFWFGKHHTEETKNRLSENAKNMSDDIKKRISESLKGRKASEETKLKMSISNSGEKNSMFNRKHTEESKNKISEKLSFKKMNIESSSYHVGVSFNKKKEKWYSCIRFNRENCHLGIFDTEQEAINAYNFALDEIKMGIFVKKRGITSRCTKEKILNIKTLLDQGFSVVEICGIIKASRSIVYKTKNGGFDCIYNLSEWSEVT